MLKLTPLARTLARPAATPGLRASLPARPLHSAVRPRARLPPPPVSQVRFVTGAGDGERKGLRISHLFTGLVGAGLLVTIYGLLEWYYSLQIWPEPVRGPLKSALKAKNRGDTERAVKFFREAIAAALSITPEALGEDPLLKLSGIYISLAAMEEQAGQPVRAFDDYRAALEHFGPSPLARDPAPTSGWAGERPLTKTELTRAIGLAQKVGILAARFGGMGTPPTFPLPGGEGVVAGRKEWDNCAEKYLGDCVAALLRLGLPARPTDATGPVVVGRDFGSVHDAESPVMDDGSGTVNRRGLGIVMEALAEVCARQGKPDWAGQLLIQAISILLPPQDAAPSFGDRCQAAMLMTSVSSLALVPHTEQAIKASKSWSVRANELAEETAKQAGWTGPTDLVSATCYRAMSVAHYNLGMHAEMQKDNKDAAVWFDSALQIARATGFAEGKREASEALRRVRQALGQDAQP